MAVRKQAAGRTFGPVAGSLIYTAEEVFVNRTIESAGRE